MSDSISRFPWVAVRLAALGAVTVLAVSACGGSDDPKGSGSASTPASSSASGSAGGSASASSSAASEGDPALAKKVEAIRATLNGTGTFTTTDSNISGQRLSKITGSFDASAKAYTADIAVADGKGGTATAKVRVLGETAYLQVDRWKKAVRQCWLKTTPDDLTTGYALELGTAGDPLPLQLLGKFTAVSTATGDEVIQGEVPLTEGVLVLGGDIKRELISAKPQGNVAAFLTTEGEKVTLTIPGYTLSDSLSRSLKADEAKFSGLKNERYESTIQPAELSSPPAAPPAEKTMSEDDLQANRCG